MTVLEQNLSINWRIGKQQITCELSRQILVIAISTIYTQRIQCIQEIPFLSVDWG